ncbi:MAG: DUF3343 domain-containing protein [Lachnospiraceae bacterium]|nr:DUF3343 domain-containing protein [Lachnospiraceae bacterium]MDY5741382.1 DUF3343 domain-containing protein [Lachnospiraceae bacterium]
MIRQKQEICLLTFENTHEAMRFEALAAAAGLNGRLIPLPGQIRAGCGLAWRSPAALYDSVVKLAEEREIKDSEIHRLLL